MFLEFAKGLEGIDPGVVINVSEIILATIKHKLPENCDPNVNLDLIKLFLDLDLSVLGWPEDADEFSGGERERQFPIPPFRIGHW